MIKILSESAENAQGNAPTSIEAENSIRHRSTCPIIHPMFCMEGALHTTHDTCLRLYHESCEANQNSASLLDPEYFAGKCAKCARAFADKLFRL